MEKLSIAAVIACIAGSLFAHFARQLSAIKNENCQNGCPGNCAGCQCQPQKV